MKILCVRVCVCLQERLHSMEGLSGRCSESDPVSDQRLWLLQEPGFRADQDFPGAQGAAAKKGAQLTNTLVGDKKKKKVLQAQNLGYLLKKGTV